MIPRAPTQAWSATTPWREQRQVENPWFTGQAAVVSFEPEELFGTKLRALLQRRKGNDLFDL
jgi:hypothetical protein